MKKIAFHSGQLGLRGTEVALYDYARYNEEILGNKSIITVQDPNIRKGWSDPSAIKKFKDRFPVFYYKDFSEVDKILDDNNIDIFYMQKAGDRSILPKEIKTVIHSVFQYNEPHGDVYAYISKWLGDLYNKPYVPYICDLPNHNDDLRELLKIPKDATVFGRHGGIETFDIGYAQESVIEISNERDDIYFIFLNTQRFTNNKNVIFLNGTSDMYQKVRFINTCDAMLHARQRGESFGLAIAEFSLRNKPIICWKGGTDLAHVDMLGDTAFYYENKTELKSILSDFKIDNSVNYDIYKKYNPKDVMQKFKEVFIDK
tara:strand:+ start:27 stop:971 length:945 start_codon:yes stop_codon:yes gene_type:complete